MNLLADWFAMGGYGWYVWPSYIVGITILVLNVWLPLRYHQRLLKYQMSKESTD